MKHDSWKNWCGKRYSPLAIAGMVIGGLALAVIFAFLFGWAVMLLWNALMPEIFGLPLITYWQGWGLVLLSHILLKGGWGGHGGHGGRDDGEGKCCSDDEESWCCGSNRAKKDLAEKLRDENPDRVEAGED